MKKLVLSALLMVGMAAAAQEGKPMRVLHQKDQTEQRDQQRFKRLTTELNLDATQRKALAEVLEQGAEKRGEFKAEHKANKDNGVKFTPEQRKERRAEMEAFRDAQDEKIKKILRKDQLVQWEKLKEAEKAKRQEKMQRRAESIQKSE